jgi:hypothetical protein
MKSSHHEQIRRSNASPDQNSPTGGFCQFTKIDEDAKGLSELLEVALDKLRESPRLETPAREESIEKIVYD